MARSLQTRTLTPFDVESLKVRWEISTCNSAYLPRYRLSFSLSLLPLSLMKRLYRQLSRGFNKAGSVEAKAKATNAVVTCEIK